MYSFKFINNLLKYDKNKEIKRLMIITTKDSFLPENLKRNNRITILKVIDRKNPIYVKKILFFLSKFKPDVINIEWDHNLYSPKLLLGSYLFPLIYKFRDSIFLSLHSLYRLREVLKVLRSFYPGFICYGVTKKFLVHTPKIIRVFTLYEYEQLSHVREKPKFLIPEGIEKCSILPPPRHRRSINLSIFGFIRKTKNYKLAMDALKFLPRNFKLIIAGHPHDCEVLKEIHRYLKKNPSLKSRVKVIPKFLTLREKISLFRISHVFLLPYTLISNSGIIYECLKYGRPIVANVLKKDIEKMGIGKYSRDNPIELSSAIVDVIEEYRKYYKRIEIVRKRFVWEKIIAQVLNAYRLLHKKGYETFFNFRKDISYCV